jgi:hypothetical protein
LALAQTETYNQYFSSNTTNLFDATGLVKWDVEGNLATGIKEFIHNDEGAFPSGAEFTLPAQIDINADFTLTHSSAGNVSGIIYTATGKKGQLSKSVMGSGTSITFTAAELNQVALAGDGISISVMPIKITSAGYNGIKYFVKQFLQERPTATL